MLRAQVAAVALVVLAATVAAPQERDVDSVVEAMMKAAKVIFQPDKSDEPAYEKAIRKAVVAAFRRGDNRVKAFLPSEKGVRFIGYDLDRGYVPLAYDSYQCYDAIGEVKLQEAEAIKLAKRILAVTWPEKLSRTRMVCHFFPQRDTHDPRMGVIGPVWDVEFVGYRGDVKTTNMAVVKINAATGRLSTLVTKWTHPFEGVPLKPKVSAAKAIEIAVQAAKSKYPGRQIIYRDAPSLRPFLGLVCDEQMRPHLVWTVYLEARGQTPVPFPTDVVVHVDAITGEAFFYIKL